MYQFCGEELPPGLQEMDENQVAEIADAHESQILQQSADGERPRRLPNLMEGGAVFESPPPAHSEPLRGLDSAVSRGKTTRGKGRKGSRTRGRGKEVAPD